MPRLPSSTHARPARSRVFFPFPPLPEDSPVKDQLERILASRTFSGARRSQHFLRYILHHALAHTDEQLKEYSIAIDVFGRDSSYDPAVNNTVRVEAGRLRSRLLEYYANEGHADPLFIEIPKGSYRVVVHERGCAPGAALSPFSAAKPPGSFARRAVLPLWAVPFAFLIGAFIGYRAAH